MSRCENEQDTPQWFRTNEHWAAYWWEYWLGVRQGSCKEENVYNWEVRRVAYPESPLIASGKTNALELAQTIATEAAVRAVSEEQSKPERDREEAARQREAAKPYEHAGWQHNHAGRKT